MDYADALAIGHVVAALSALLVGVAVLFSRKGTRAHRAMGNAYLIALVLANVAALSLHRESTFGLFHVLAVASLGTLAVGLTPMLLGRTSPMVVSIHAYCMTWSYAGLAAAGFGQLAVALGEDRGAWLLPVVIATVFVVSGIAIFGKVPATLNRVLG